MNDDSPTVRQALRQEDADSWILAMKQEIAQLENIKHGRW